MLCLVERRSFGRLGSNLAAPAIHSRRNSQEKEPWKSLPGVEGNVEAEFLRPVLLGESILPWRVWNPFEGVIPINGDGTLLDAEAAANRGYGGLHDWLRKVEQTWGGDRPSEITFNEQINYYGKLTAQFPAPEFRIVYAASGTLPAAALVNDSRAIIEHALYWAKPQSIEESRFLLSILNNDGARTRIEQFQSRGQFGARHFDKVIFNLPIPRFDASNGLHQALAEAGARAETLVATFALPDGVKFQRARALVRTALDDAGINQEIDDLVLRLLDSAR